jgi:hypothetical protein
LSSKVELLSPSSLCCVVFCCVARNHCIADEPGVLVPLAQAALSVDHWMEAVDAAGPATPLSDPSFEGTVFIPDDVVSTPCQP